MRTAALVLLYAAILGAADEAEVPNGLRLATRLSDGRVFIQGGEGKTDIVITKPDILPVDAGLRGGFEHVTPEYMAKFQTDHPTKWHPGDRWKVYTGAGAPLTVVIQDLVMMRPYSGAIAVFEDKDAADRVAGLRATEYLAAPAPGISQVSGQPLMPFLWYNEVELQIKVEQTLRARGRQLVGSGDWTDPDSRLDELFLHREDLSPDIHVSRWSLPRQKPLLFVEILWRDAARIRVFGANAVVEEGASLSILDFDPWPGQAMRRFDAEGQPYEPAFLNAWAIGNRRYVLRFRRGYESIGMQLMELVPTGNGLVPTWLSFGAGA